MIKKLSTVAVAAAVVTTLACGRTNEAVEQRPDGAANDRAVAVTNSTDATKAESSSDTSITTKVQAKFLGDAAVKGRRINVETRDGIVTLTGGVGCEGGRATRPRNSRRTPPT